MENEIVLPFGDMEIVIASMDTATYKRFRYHLALRKPGCQDIDALYLKGAYTVFAGKQYQDNLVIIPLDLNDPTTAIQYALLNPGNRPCVIQREDGSLYCTKCQCRVVNTANYEMRKEGAYAHSHICGKKAKDEECEKE